MLSQVPLYTEAHVSSLITLRSAEQDVDSTGPVDLVLLGNDNGEGSSGSAYVLQCLG